MNWSNLTSLRVALGALIVAALVAALPSMVWPPLGTVVFVAVLLACYYNALFNPRFQAYCQHCRKRVKLGAAACHHCGRTTG